MQYIALQCSVNSILSVLNPEYQNFLRRCIFSELLIYPFSSKRSPFVIISLHNPHNSNWFHDHLTPPPKKVYNRMFIMVSWCPCIQSVSVSGRVSATAQKFSQVVSLPGMNLVTLVPERHHCSCLWTFSLLSPVPTLTLVCVNFLWYYEQIIHLCLSWQELESFIETSWFIYSVKLISQNKQIKVNLILILSKWIWNVT